MEDSRRLTGLDGLETAISCSDPQAPLHVGQVICLGLETIKARLGEARFAKAADFVDRQLLSALRAELDEGDRFLRSRDGSYVIVFASPDPLHANAKASRIAETVNRRLFGADESAGVEVASMVASDEGVEAGKNRSSADIIEGLAERARAVSLGDSAGVSAAPPAGTPPASAARATPDDEAADIFESLASNEDEVGLSVGYVPVYDVKRETVDRFLCVPMRQDPLTATQYLSYDTLPPDHSQDDLFKLDLDVFEEALRGHVKCLKQGLFIYTGVNIHFETLSAKHCRERILSILRRAPTSVRRSFVPVIHSIPSGVTDARFQELFAPLQTIVKEVVVSIDPRAYQARLSHHILKLASNGLTRVILEVPENLDPSDQSWIAALQRGGFQSSVSLTADGVCTPIVADRLKELGAAYACGPLLGGPFREPSPTYSLPYKDLSQPGLCALAYAKVAAFEKARMQAIADHFGVVFAVTKPDSSGAPCFYYLSPQAQALTGYPRVELIGAPIATLQCAETDHQAAAAFFKRLRRLGEASVSLANRRKDGGVFINRITATAPPPSHNAPKGTFYAFLNEGASTPDGPPAVAAS